METDRATAAASQRMRYHFSRLQTAPQFAALLDCLFDLSPRRTEPAFAELTLVEGELLFARTEGDEHFRHYVGRRDDLLENLVGFVRHLGLGADEHGLVLERVANIPCDRVIA